MRSCTCSIALEPVEVSRRLLALGVAEGSVEQGDFVQQILKELDPLLQLMLMRAAEGHLKGQVRFPLRRPLLVTTAFPANPDLGLADFRDLSDIAAVPSDQLGDKIKVLCLSS